MADFGARFRARTEGYRYLDVHPAAGCRGCFWWAGDPEHPTPDEMACVSEGSFSWAACDTCGTTLGGTRSPAHAVADGVLVHLDVCTDCYCYIAHGELPDAP